MDGPGEYIADSTEGITRVENLPPPRIERRSRDFLDDRSLPATSNAVERSNRRYRKAQRSVYSVRTAEHIRQRIAMDMEREQRTPDRRATTQTLHRLRTGTG